MMFATVVARSNHCRATFTRCNLKQLFRNDRVRHRSTLAAKVSARDDQDIIINPANVEDVAYWRSVSDSVEITGDDSQGIKFTVKGNPLPLQRHRSSNGYMYNPSAAKQKLFRNVVKDILCGCNNLEMHGEKPLFEKEEYLAMNILFRMKRPKKHFRNNKPGDEGGLVRLKESSPVNLCGSRVDVDNLAKFVLDACNGLLYHDDRQIISLNIAKVYDCEGQCTGATQIFVRPISEATIASIMLMDHS